MTVARADANGAGSGSSVVQAGTTADNTKTRPVGAANIDGPNTAWSATRKEPGSKTQDARASAPEALDYTRIIDALDKLSAAEASLRAAFDRHKNRQSDDQLYTEYRNAQTEYQYAQIKLGEAIQKETTRVSGPNSSSISEGQPDNGKVRELEGIILKKLPSQQGKLYEETR
jgi:hypothetical protein